MPLVYTRMSAEEITEIQAKKAAAKANKPATTNTFKLTVEERIKLALSQIEKLESAAALRKASVKPNALSLNKPVATALGQSKISTSEAKLVVTNNDLVMQLIIANNAKNNRNKGQ